MRLGVKYGVVAAGLFFGVNESLGNLRDNPRVGRFIHYYRATKNTDAPVNFWERLVYSFLLTTIRADASPGPMQTATCGQDAGAQAVCARAPHPFRSTRAAYPYRL